MTTAAGRSPRIPVSRSLLLPPSSPRPIPAPASPNPSGASPSAFPLALEIQTTSACNSGCVICPHPDIRSGATGDEMDEGLFARIISECAPHQNGLRIAPYLNAEPFLDARFLSRLELIQALCPRAEVEVSTNVSRLTRNVRREIAQRGLRELRLSVFGFSPATHRKMMPGLDWSVVWRHLKEAVTDGEFRSGVGELALVMIDHPWVPDSEYRRAAEFCGEHGLTFHLWGFLDRAGNVRRFSHLTRHERVVGCRQGRPFERLHVLHDGLVILCCQDWRATVILGDLRRQSVEEIWRSPAYEQVRRATLGQEEPQPEVCRRCQLAVTA
jgi:radical SAM protein with 4Fe4S-binding SPASM domain